MNWFTNYFKSSDDKPKALEEANNDVAAAQNAVDAAKNALVEKQKELDTAQSKKKDAENALQSVSSPSSSLISTQQVSIGGKSKKRRFKRHKKTRRPRS